MSTYAYTAYDSKGKLFTGDIEERTWTQALRRVREMGLFPACVKGARPAAASGEIQNRNAALPPAIRC